jgi:hypothetical protein
MKKFTLILAILFLTFITISLAYIVPKVVFTFAIVILSVISLFRIMNYFVNGE